MPRVTDSLSCDCHICKLTNSEVLYISFEQTYFLLLPLLKGGELECDGKEKEEGAKKEKGRKTILQRA